MSIAKRRDTLAPLIANPSTCARECVPPCQALATRQWVMPFAGSPSTSSISVCTASVSMPLTMLEDDEETVCSMTVVDIVWFLSCNKDWREGSGCGQLPHWSEGSERVVYSAE